MRRPDCPIGCLHSPSISAESFSVQARRTPSSIARRRKVARVVGLASRMGRAPWIALIGAAVFLCPVSSVGQIVTLSGPEYCLVRWSFGGHVELDVEIIGVQAKGARFALSAPSDCGALVFQVVPSPGVLLEGDPASGITLQFDCGDYPRTIKVATLNVFFAHEEPEPCSPISVLPHPDAATGKVELIGCDESTIAGWGGQLFVRDDGYACSRYSTSFQPPPQAPDPPPAAERVPLDQQLSWIQASAWSCAPALTGRFNNVYFGTESPPPRVCWGCEFLLVDPITQKFAYDPGMLQAATTYYWRVQFVSTAYGSGLSPEWNFTTGDVVPVTETTWGRIKRIYR